MKPNWQRRLKKISGQVISTLFEQRKVDDLVKHYTEDCKFIFLPENQTMSGRQGELVAMHCVTFMYHSNHFDTCMLIL